MQDECQTCARCRPCKAHLARNEEIEQAKRLAAAGSLSRRRSQLIGGVERCCGLTHKNLSRAVRGKASTYARLHQRGSKLYPRSDLTLIQKTVAPFEFRTGLKIEMKFISNRRNWRFKIWIRDQQPTSTNICSHPNKAKRVPFQDGGRSPGFRTRESCRTMPLVGGGDRLFFPHLHSGAAPYSPRFVLISFEHLDHSELPEGVDFANSYDVRLDFKNEYLWMFLPRCQVERSRRLVTARLRARVRSSAEMRGRGKTGDLRENPPTRGIVRHDSQIGASEKKPRRQEVTHIGHGVAAILLGAHRLHLLVLEGAVVLPQLLAVLQQHELITPSHAAPPHPMAGEAGWLPATPHRPHRAHKVNGSETPWRFLWCGRTHSLIGCARLWERALHLTGHCVLRNGWADWRMALHLDSYKMDGNRTKTVDPWQTKRCPPEGEASLAYGQQMNQRSVRFRTKIKVCALGISFEICGSQLWTRPGNTVHIIQTSKDLSNACVLVSPVSLPRFLNLDAQVHTTFNFSFPDHAVTCVCPPLLTGGTAVCACSNKVSQLLRSESMTAEDDNGVGRQDTVKARGVVSPHAAVGARVSTQPGVRACRVCSEPSVNSKAAAGTGELLRAGREREKHPSPPPRKRKEVDDPGTMTRIAGGLHAPVLSGSACARKLLCVPLLGRIYNDPSRPSVNHVTNSQSEVAINSILPSVKTLASFNFLTDERMKLQPSKLARFGTRSPKFLTRLRSGKNNTHQATLHAATKTELTTETMYWKERANVHYTAHCTLRVRRSIATSWAAFASSTSSVPVHKEDIYGRNHGRRRQVWTFA
ncbi:hypothetical protein PR048_027967 [Dryococelus australis]|uniref:Ribosomal protein L2 n=1 Tax=Dryococelus australis TaxID=614101 RepID=A0ABQ9GHZ6_9NEOP|nr:hypothetical protein PR048_027967 [Dryococelus australis]